MGKRIATFTVALILALALGGCAKLKVSSDVDVTESGQFTPSLSFTGWHDTERESAFPAAFYLGADKEENKRLVMADKLIPPMNLIVCRPDGSEKLTILQDVRYAQFYNGCIYYLDTLNNLYKIPLGGYYNTSDPYKIGIIGNIKILVKSFPKEQYTQTTDGKETKYYVEDVWYFKIFEDNIFYCVSSPADEDTHNYTGDKLYRMDTEGQNTQLITANADINEKGGDLYYTDGRVYYPDVEDHAKDYDTEDEEFSTFDMMRYDLKTGLRGNFALDVSGVCFFNYGTRYYFGYYDKNREVFKVSRDSGYAQDLPFKSYEVWSECKRYYQWIIRTDIFSGTINAYDLTTGKDSQIAKLPKGKSIIGIDTTPDGIYVICDFNHLYDYRVYLEDGKFVAEPFKQ